MCVASFYKNTVEAERHNRKKRTEENVLHRHGRFDSVDRCEHKEEDVMSSNEVIVIPML